MAQKTRQTDPQGFWVGLLGRIAGGEPRQHWQLATTVPLLKLSQNGFAIRGIVSNNGFSGYSTVATQIDGIYNPFSAALTMAVFDIASVEVLRGPQGTVYGRNATAGVVNINTADPGRTYGGSASVQYGRFNDIRAQAAIDLPVSDTFGIRIAAFHQINDGYGPQFEADRFDKSDLLGTRVTAKWEITPTLTWRVSGAYGENNSTVPAVYLRNYTYYPDADLKAGTFGKGVIVPSDAVNPGLDTVAANRQAVKSYDVRSRIVWRASNALSLTWLAGYSELKNNGVAASTGVFSQEYLNQRMQTWSHELDVNYESGPLKLVAGAYISEDKQPSGLRINLGLRSTWDSGFLREQQLVCPGDTVTRSNISATTCPTSSTPLANTDDSNRPA